MWFIGFNKANPNKEWFVFDENGETLISELSTKESAFNWAIGKNGPGYAS